MKSFAVLGLLLSVAMPLLASDTRPYAIELLIFVREEPVQSIDEVFPKAAPTAPSARRFIDALAQPGSGLIPLPSAEHVLGEAARQLRRGLDAEILFHQRWIHDLKAPSAVIPWYAIKGLSQRGIALDGFMRWSIDRFIELDADFRVTRVLGRAQDGSPNTEVYRLREFRKMSSKDIHYLDHPAFGVIISMQQITETPKPAQTP